MSPLELWSTKPFAVPLPLVFFARPAKVTLTGLGPGFGFGFGGLGTVPTVWMLQVPAAAQSITWLTGLGCGLICCRLLPELSDRSCWFTSVPRPGTPSV